MSECSLIMRESLSALRSLDDWSLDYDGAHGSRDTHSGCACALVLIVLGVLFWTGRALALINVHMLAGVLLVVALWLLAALAVRVRLSAGLAALAVVWGLAVLVLGMTQTSLLPGDAHWVIQVVHLLIGLGAVGLAERLERQIVAAHSTRAGP